ncbi:MAG: hypothetical protein MPJ50_05025 [Pirellulales bacterium]|nr:hypothetical protein [Pirellulales bacterium]
MTILAVAQDPSTEIISLKPISWNGTSLECLTTRHRSINRRTHKEEGVTVRYYLDPGRDWICMRQTIETMEGGIRGWIELTCKYNESSEGLPPLLEVVTSMGDTSDNPATNRVLGSTTVTSFRHTDDPITEGECRLIAFGFPEPGGVKWGEPVSWWVWLGYVGGGCLLLAFFFFLMKQRVASKAGTN